MLSNQTPIPSLHDLPIPPSVNRHNRIKRWTDYSSLIWQLLLEISALETREIELWEAGVTLQFVQRKLTKLRAELAQAEAKRDELKAEYWGRRVEVV